MSIKIVSIVLISLFYVIYFLKQISLRRKNIQTNRLAKGIKDEIVARNERRLLSLTYATALLQYLSTFKFKLVGVVSPIFMIQLIGIILASAGIMLFLLAVLNMQESWRAGIDETQQTELVTSGIYRFSRNPAFAGFDLFYLGVVLMVPSLLLIVFSLLTVLCLHRQILAEEKYLTAIFAEDYLSYKRKTRRYF